MRCGRSIMQFVHLCGKTSPAQLSKGGTVASNSHGFPGRFDKEVERCRVIPDQLILAGLAGGGFATPPDAAVMTRRSRRLCRFLFRRSAMLTDALAHPRSSEQPLSSLCRAVGLAAVAAELNLHLHTLEPVTAAAVERGAAALFLAGYSRRTIGHTSGARLNEKTGERKGRSGLTDSTRSVRPRKKNVRSR
jgi:hypothetical protein